MWISVDGGTKWAQYKGSDFPSVAVRDIVVQPRESDLVLATHGRGIWIIDDISPLRALTPELMPKTAAFIPGRPAMQYIDANASWPQGDETFIGPSRPTDALITYYQKSRHIYGDMKIEIFDSQGRLVDTVSGTKHRGLNRATWSMRLKAPTVPPAASAAFGAIQGPLVVPGTYTVKMTKGDEVYTTELKVIGDPRTKYTMAERQAQFDLTMKLYNMLDHMSWAVDSIIGIRNAANERAAQLPAGDPLRERLTQLAASADKIRSEIVATKEGGAITGEERLREFLTTVYGDVNGYAGPPTASQIDRTEVLGRELEDVIKKFQTQIAGPLPGINRDLEQKKLEPIQVISESDWQKQRQEAPPAKASGMEMRERD